MKKKTGVIVRGLDGIGVKNFLYNFLYEIRNEDSVVVFTDEKSLMIQFPRLEVIYIKKCNKLIWDYIYLPYRAFRENISEMIYTKNVIPLTHLPFLWKKKLIIYDLGYFEDGLRAYRFLDTIYMKMMINFSINIADTVITISDFSRRAIKDLSGKKDIRVAYLDVPRTLKSASRLSWVNVQNKYKLKKPYVVYVGSISPRKNILRMLRAFSNASTQIPHMLYIVSDSSWRSEREWKYIQENSENIGVLSGVTDQELKEIYKNADMALFLSLYEGFGLPIIESQFFSCPIITSNLGACKEIAGDYPLTINPYDEDAISKMMVELHSSKALRKSAVKAGKRNLRRFSWRKSIKLILE